MCGKLVGRNPALKSPRRKCSERTAATSSQNAWPTRAWSLRHLDLFSSSPSHAGIDPLPLVLSLATIGVTTALSSALGRLAGRRFGALLGKRLDVVGGLVLIGLGTKILVGHLQVM